MMKKLKLALLTLAIKSLAIWPLRALYLLSDFLYPIVYYVVGYRRKVVRKNMTSAFPEKSEKEIIQMEKKFYRHFCDYLIETLKLMHISDNEMRRRMKFTNSELIEDLRSDGRPIFLYLGHQGNWEYVISITLWTHPDLAACQIYHPLSNKTMDKLVYNLRSRFHSTGIAQKQTLRVILTMIKEGKQPLLGLIADQRPPLRQATTWMRFLNQDTPIITGGETMGVKLNAHFLYGSIQCTKRGHYEITLHPIKPIKEEEFSHSKQYMRMLEKDIVASPHLWLWTHNRWRFRYEQVYPGQERPDYLNAP